VEVSVILLGLKEEPEADTKCNDKFLIVALPAPYDIGESSVAEVWPKLETEFKPQSVSTKIKVKYIVEGTSGTAAISSGIDAAEPISSKTKELLDEKVSEDVSQEDRSKIDALNEKLDSTVAASASPAEKSSASTTSGQQIPSQSSPAPFTTIILLAIIAVIIAWLFM
jgi:cobalamin biosynthesis Mg chelatase CobN